MGGDPSQARCGAAGEADHQVKDAGRGDSVAVGTAGACPSQQGDRGAGIGGAALTTLLWNWGIHRVPASRAGVFLNIEPALGSWLGVRLLGEHLGPYAWAGGALILGAAITLTVREHPSRDEAGSLTEPEIILE